MATPGSEFHTGQIAPVSGEYVYVRHMDGRNCTPTQEERVIQLRRGTPFPPHASCGQGVVWRLLRAHE